MPDMMNGPDEFMTYVNKKNRDVLAMPILSILNKLEYIRVTKHGITSKVASWEDFYAEFEENETDETELILSIFDDKESTERAKDLLSKLLEFKEQHP